MTTTATFVQESELETMLATEAYVVVDCTATWCGPCKVVAPLIDRLAGEYAGRASVVKLDLDQNKALAKQYEVRSIPAVLIFKGGELVERMVGVAPYESFSEALDRHL